MMKAWLWVLNVVHVRYMRVLCWQKLWLDLAIDFCKEMGFSKIVSEGDSLQVIKGICDSGSLFVRIGAICGDN
jgi:hypothetical protein